MSLLEDVFLQDEAGEAQELERIIEGDEYEERQRQSSDSDENSEKEDEAEEDKRRVDPASTKTKRVTKNPRFVLNPARLTGPRGISVIPEHFKDFKFKGKGHEKEDLDLVLKKLEHWAYRLYPKFKFEDCLKKIETLGKKRVVSVHLQKIRSDQLITEEAVVQKDSSDEELAAPLPEEDEFDQLLQQQIDLARATPAHEGRPGFTTPASGHKRSPLNTMMPKATSSPSISDEQRERMIRNRRLAEERRLARLKGASIADANNISTVDLTNGSINRNELPSVNDEVEEVLNVSNERRSKKNRSNVIDSSDDDDETNNEATVKAGNENMIDLTDSNHQLQKDITGKEKDTEVVEVENNVHETINLTENFENPKAINQMIDLTEVQVSNNYVTNQVDNMGIQNVNEDVDSIDQPVTVDQNIVDLTEIQAQKTIITNNEFNSEQYEISNSVDSSDNEDILVVNESIVVEVHKGKSNHNTEEINTGHEMDDAITDAKNIEVNDHNKQKLTSNIDDSDEVLCEADDLKTNASSAKKSEIEITDFVHNVEEFDTITDGGDTRKSQDNSGAVNVLNNVNTEEGTNKSGNNIIHTDDALDDLMDVDFSEDF